MIFEVIECQSASQPCRLLGSCYIFGYILCVVACCNNSCRRKYSFPISRNDSFSGERKRGRERESERKGRENTDDYM